MAGNKLTDTRIRKFKTDKTQEWLGDGGGLLLSVKPSSKSWVFRYKKGGKTSMIGLGAYPAVSLLDARQKRDAIKKIIAAGEDPRATKEDATPTTFGQVTKDWLIVAKKRRSEQRLAKIEQALNKHVLPILKDRQINKIKATEVIALLQKTEESGTYIVVCVHRYLSWIFDFAVSIGKIESVPITKASLTHVSPHKSENVRSMKFERLPDFLGDLGDYSGLRITKLSIKFIMLTAVRTIELRRLQWGWIDNANAKITIPASQHKTGIKLENNGKGGENFYVLLSTQALQILEKARAITGESEFVFPSPYNHAKMASDAIINKALERMGWKDEHDGHGFRALFRSQMRKEGYDKDHLELCLNHVIARNKTEGDYERGMNDAFHPERQQLMQAWADLIAKQKNLDF